MRTLPALVLTALLSAAFAAGSPASAAKYALLVGVGDYGVPQWRLKASLNDLIVMADLCRQWGVPPANVTVLKDAAATSDAILGALARLNGLAKKGDQVTFYFSGHAVEVRDLQGDEKKANPLDSDDEALVVNPLRPDGNPSLLLDDRLGRALQPMPARGVQVLCILDCCYAYDGTRDAATALELGPEKTLRGKWQPGGGSPTARKPNPSSVGMLLSAGSFHETTREVNWRVPSAKVPVSPLTLTLWAFAGRSANWTELLGHLQTFNQQQRLPWRPALRGMPVPWRRCAAPAAESLELTSTIGRPRTVAADYLRGLVP